MKNSTYYIFFKNLSNSLRIKIISSLTRKPSSVSELSKKLKIEQSKLSHSLSSLRKCRIVRVSTAGKRRIYSLNEKTILPILGMIDKHAKTYCRSKCSFCTERSK